MTNLATIKLLFDYHYWANANCLRACETLTTEQWDKPLGPSWGSVHSLLTHMLAAEYIWVARWEGNSKVGHFKPEDYPALANLRVRWAIIETRARTFIAQCDDARLAADLNYQTTKGDPQAQPLGDLMLHLTNHGTHHRGELAALLTLLGVPHPEDDLLFYLRQSIKPR